MIALRVKLNYFLNNRNSSSGFVSFKKYYIFNNFKKIKHE